MRIFCFCFMYVYRNAFWMLMVQVCHDWKRKHSVILEWLETFLQHTEMVFIFCSFSIYFATLIKPIRSPWWMLDFSFNMQHHMRYLQKPYFILIFTSNFFFGGGVPGGCAAFWTNVSWVINWAGAIPNKLDLVENKMDSGTLQFIVHGSVFQVRFV